MSVGASSEEIPLLVTFVRILGAPPSFTAQALFQWVQSKAEYALTVLIICWQVEMQWSYKAGMGNLAGGSARSVKFLAK